MIIQGPISPFILVANDGTNYAFNYMEAGQIGLTSWTKKTSTLEMNQDKGYIRYASQ